MMSNKIEKILVIWLCTAIFTTVFAVALPFNASAYTTHDPIYIKGNAAFTPANGVTGGSGTQSDPYIIEGWDINALSDHGIEICNTDMYFVIRNCYVHDGKNNYQSGIFLYNVQNGQVENTIPSNNYAGIELLLSSNNNISNNNVLNNNYGIDVRHSSNNNNIHNNNASNNLVAIVLHSSNKNNIYNNSALNNYYGIRLYYSSNNNIYNNSVLNSGDGITLFISSKNNIFNNNVLNNGGGIDLWGSSNNNISNNNVNSNNWYGIHMDSSSNNNISNNNVNSNNHDGIHLYYSSNNNVLYNNNVLNNGDGFYLWSSSNNRIFNNIASSNKGHGIYLYNSLNNEIINCDIMNNGINGINFQFSTAEVNGNKILNNGWIKVPSWYYPAIFCYESSPTITNNTISGSAWAAYFKDYCSLIIRNNEINDNWVGIWAEPSTDSIIESNTISNNLCGIYLDCSHNKIFHNNFISNTIQIYGYGINQWDDGYPSGGNYWSDYTGEDYYSGVNQNIPDSDGIGDTPYYIDWRNQDNYPLMSPWEKPKGPEISVEKEFIPSEITTMSRKVISAINITNIGDVDITSMTIVDEYVENMAPNESPEVLVTITSDEGEVYAIMPEDLDIILTDSNITISFELPLEVVPVFWENSMLQFGEELYYLECISKDWVVGVRYLLYPVTELEIGTYAADATVIAYSETGTSTTETSTGILTVSPSIELAFPTN
jgi:parallel beta-helix repeat protein